MPIIELPGGFSVRAFEASKDTFDSTRLSPEELSIYGFPPASTKNSGSWDRWQNAIRGCRLEIPRFSLRERTRKPYKVFAKDSGPQEFDNWAGAYATPPQGDSLNWVEANWIFPHSALPAGADKDLTYSASTWIGLDGDNGTSDIVQAGCDSDVRLSNGKIQHEYKMWWEWWPGKSFWIDSIVVKPGNEVSLIVWSMPGSTTVAKAFIANRSTGQSHIFDVIPPQGTYVAGTSAEWIVEALQINSDLYALAKFDPVLFSGCHCRTTNGVDSQLMAGNIIQMTSGNSVIAGARLASPTNVEIKCKLP